MTTEGVGWASEEASDLVVPPLNLMLYMHLRVFAYTSNTLIASFEYMELILPSGVEMYTCSNTALGRKRKNRWFCFFIFKTPPLFFDYTFFSFKHVRLTIRIERCSPVR